MSWFHVDKAGLAAILARRGKAFALFELIQNSWDSGTDRVEVYLEPVPGAALLSLRVEDWGDGFADLEDAYTMFKPSRRASDADKRGRFSLGEKLVLALCRSARIITTSGSVVFASGQDRQLSSQRREQGTLFEAEIRMTRDELGEVGEAVRRLIPPVPTRFNGQLLDQPAPLVTFETKLPTEIADAEGQLRRSVRLARVEVFETCGPGELLELGIPVVETDNHYRVNVLQKIPLNSDRDNVSPAFLRAIQAALLNHVHGQLDPEQAAEPWVQEAAGDARATADAVREVLAKRFGDRALVATPNDPMANAQAEAAGFTVVPGGALSAGTWANVRKHGLLVPASKAFPTPKPEVLAERNQNLCPTCQRPL